MTKWTAAGNAHNPTSMSLSHRHPMIAQTTMGSTAAIDHMDIATCQMPQVHLKSKIVGSKWPEIRISHG